MRVGQLRPIQAMAAAMFFKHKRLLLSLPRQFGGKTELGVRLCHDITSKPWTSSSLFLAKDKKSGKKATREKFERIFDKKTFTVNTEVVFLKSCPSSIVFMDSVDKDPDRIRGGTYSYIHWSEVAFSKIEHGETIISVFDKVVKPTLGETEGYVLLESTNNGKNGWYDLWENAAFYKFAKLKVGFDQMVELGLVSQEKFDEIREETHPDVFRQEYLCEWVSFQGKVYCEFDAKRHIDPDMPGPESWQKVVAAIDWGFSPSATCVLFGYVSHGILNVFAEHYAKEELPIATGIAIEEVKERFMFSELSCVADHDLARNVELTNRGIECGLASKANVMGARMEIKEALYFDRIKFHPRCKNVLRDLDAAVWDIKKEGEIDYSQCTWGHFDGEAALRYLKRELSQVEAEEPEIEIYDSMDSASARAINLVRQRYA